MLSDIGKAQSIVENIIGKKPLLYRPPVGLSNPHLAIALAKLDMMCIGWSRSTKDAGNRRLGRIRALKDLASPGRVLCMHDCLPVKEYKQEYLEALEKLCQSMKEKNITGIGVDEMFGVEAYGGNDADNQEI
jgi:peptidoglycan/xylan/chitin deacetylase (PgdA/CDA1 family)